MMIILCLIALVYSRFIFECFNCFIIVAQFHLSYSCHLHECEKTGNHSFITACGLVHYTCPPIIYKIPFWVTSGVFNNDSLYYLRVRIFVVR
jgi:hypothetical protein